MWLGELTDSDRPAMTIAIDLGRKATKQKKTIQMKRGLIRKIMIQIPHLVQVIHIHDY